MTGRSEFLKHHPETFFLDVAAVEELCSYLRQRGWLAAGEEIVAGVKAGEGNMNCVVRVTTAARCLILKQARRRGEGEEKVLDKCFGFPHTMIRLTAGGTIDRS